MKKNILIESILIWFKGTIAPKKTIRKLQTNPKMLAIICLSIFSYAFLYSITALLLYLGKVEVAIEPWMPISKDKYYLYQTFFTILWGFVTWIMLSGIAHMIAIIRKKEKKKYTFEEASIAIGLAWIIPSFYLTWTPETIFAIVKLITQAKITLPLWFDVPRLMILLPLWQIILTSINIQQTHETGWIKGLLIGFITTGLSFMMFLAFVR